MRKHSLLVASTLALVAASSLAPSLAHAACTEPDGRCGDGAGHGIKYAHPATELTPTVGFTWRQNPGYGVGFGGFGIYGRIRAGLGLSFVRYQDPAKGGYLPMFTVDLAKAPVAATWSAETKTISIKRTDSAEELALFEARYTMRPQAFAALDTSSSSTSGPWTETAPTSFLYYALNLTGVVGDVLGNPGFGIHGEGDKKFNPWGLNGFTGFLVSGGNIPANATDANSALFNVPWSLGDDPDTAAVDPHSKGTFGVYVQSNPEFSYKTRSVKYGDIELGTEDAVDLPVQAEYGNSVKVPVKVAGATRIDGNVKAKPFLFVEKVFNVNINSMLEAGFQQTTADVRIPTDPTAMIDFDFPAESEVIIPIPNVKIATTSAEFTGTVGGEGSSKVLIKNEGDAAAKLKFTKEGDFQLSTQATEIAPGGTYELIVRAKPDAAGSVTGSVKVSTNDPDSPELSFNVEGKFTDPVVEEEEGTSSSSGGKSSSSGNAADGDTTGDAAADDSGCGCKTAGTSSTTSSLGLFGSLALGLAAVIRRRRKN